MLRQALLSFLAVSTVSAIIIPVTEVELTTENIQIRTGCSTDRYGHRRCCYKTEDRYYCSFEIPSTATVDAETTYTRTGCITDRYGNRHCCVKTEDRYYCSVFPATVSEFEAKNAYTSFGCMVDRRTGRKTCCDKTEDRYYCYPGLLDATDVEVKQDVTTLGCLVDRETNRKWCCDKTEDRYICYPKFSLTNASEADELSQIDEFNSGDGTGCRKRKRGRCVGKGSVDVEASELELNSAPKCVNRGGKRCCNLGKWGWKCYSVAEIVDSEVDSLSNGITGAQKCVNRGGRRCCDLGKWGWKCYSTAETVEDVDSLGTEITSAQKCVNRGGRRCCDLGKWGWKCYSVTEEANDVEAMECFTSPNPATGNPEKCCPNKNGGFVCQPTLAESGERDPAKPRCYKRLNKICCPKIGGRYVCKKIPMESEFPTDNEKSTSGQLVLA